MSIAETVLKSILSNPNHTPADKLVLIAIAMRIGKNNTAWPSVRTIASDTALSPYTVQSSLKRLERSKALIVDHGNRVKSSVYRLGEVCYKTAQGVLETCTELRVRARAVRSKLTNQLLRACVPEGDCPTLKDLASAQKAARKLADFGTTDLAFIIQRFKVATVAGKQLPLTPDTIARWTIRESNSGPDMS